MNQLNVVLIEGNLSRDPELRYTRSGSAVANFSIGSNRRWKQDGEQKEEVSFIDVTTFGKLAEVCQEYLSKGRGVRVHGRIKQERWEDDSAQRRSRVVVIADSVDFMPQRRESNGGGEPQQQDDDAAPQFGGPQFEDVPF